MCKDRLADCLLPQSTGPHRAADLLSMVRGSGDDLVLSARVHHRDGRHSDAQSTSSQAYARR